MNVLSLFDGMSCGQIALNRLGIKYDNYFASEIKPYAIKVTQENYPSTIQLGDIKEIKGDDLPKIDLILAGSPCQDFSRANLTRDGLKGKKSSLFFEFYRLLKECKPKNYLLENVVMAQEEYDYISSLMKTYPVRINSSRVSAQMRDRLYWTNIGEEWKDLFGVRYCDIPQPIDKKIKFKDILDNGYVTKNKAYCLLEGESRPHKSNKRRFRRWRTCGFVNIVFEKENLSPFHNRILTRNEMERLQTVPINYTKSVSRNQAASLLGDGWTIDVICHILKRLSD